MWLRSPGVRFCVLHEAEEEDVTETISVSKQPLLSGQWVSLKRLPGPPGGSNHHQLDLGV